MVDEDRRERRRPVRLPVRLVDLAHRLEVSGRATPRKEQLEEADRREAERERRRPT